MQLSRKIIERQNQCKKMYLKIELSQNNNNDYNNFSVHCFILLYTERKKFD